MTPRRASSHRASPGKFGRPAASADVQPAGRTRFERRLQTAPAQACQRPPARCSPPSSYSRQADEQRIVVAAVLDVHATRDRVADAVLTSNARAQAPAVSSTTPLTLTRVAD